MKRRDQEHFIDSILDHANSLQAVIAIKTQAGRELARLSKARELTRCPNHRRELRDQYQCWMLLEHRIKITLDSYIEDALRDQQYQLLPEYERTDTVRYRYLCSFKITAKEMSSVKGYDLLIKHGWYNRDSNPGGVVKDHRLSVKQGFNSKLNPDLLAHPANCEFLLYIDNARKSSASSTSVSELQRLVEKWDAKFNRQRQKRWKEFGG